MQNASASGVFFDTSHYDGHALVIVVDRARPAGAALAAEVGSAVPPEQLGGQQIIVLGLVTGRGFFVFWLSSPTPGRTGLSGRWAGCPPGLQFP